MLNVGGDPRVVRNHNHPLFDFELGAAAGQEFPAFLGSPPQAKPAREFPVETVDGSYSGRPMQFGVTTQAIESVAYVFDGRILANPRRNTTESRGTIVKGLHAVNCALFLLNAVLWAFLAKQPAIALLWLAVGLGELYVITQTELLSN